MSFKPIKSVITEAPPSENPSIPPILHPMTQNFPSESLYLSELQLDPSNEKIDNFISRAIQYEKGAISKENFIEDLKGWFPMLKNFPRAHMEINITFPQCANPFNPAVEEKRPTFSTHFVASEESSVKDSQDAKIERDYKDLGNISSQNNLSLQLKKIRHYWNKKNSNFPFVFRKTYFFVEKIRKRKFLFDFIELGLQAKDSQTV